MTKYYVLGTVAALIVAYILYLKRDTPYNQNIRVAAETSEYVPEYVAGNTTTKKNSANKISLEEFNQKVQLTIPAILKNADWLALIETMRGQEWTNLAGMTQNQAIHASARDNVAKTYWHD